MRSRDEGFTLIELLVVIIILAVLAAVVVFAVGGLGDKGAASACKSDVKTIETAAGAFYAQNQAPVAHLQDLMPDFIADDPTIAGDTKSAPGANGYTITFTPGTGAGDVGSAVGDLNGGSVTTDCSA